MTTSQQRKTDAGKGDADRGDLSKRRLSPFYWRSACCEAHVTLASGEGGWSCMKCKNPCEVVKP